MFHTCAYNSANFFSIIYPEIRDKINDPRAVIVSTFEMHTRAANSTEYDVLLVGGMELAGQACSRQYLQVNGWKKIGKKR